MNKDVKFDLKRTIIVTLPFAAAIAFWQAYDNIIPLILKDTFHLGDTVSGVIMALDNILALFLLPFFGSWSDKTNTKYGRRIPFIFVGTIIAAGLIPLIPLADQWQNFPLFIGVLVTVLLALSSYRSASVALMPDVTPRPWRSKADAINSLSATCATVLILIVMAVAIPATQHPDYTIVFLAIVGLMLLALFVIIKFFNEPKMVQKMQQEEALMNIDESQVSESHHSDSKAIRYSMFGILACVFCYFMAFNAVSTSFSKYATVIWKMAGGGYANFQLIVMAFTILSYLPMANLSLKIGRKRTTLLGFILMSIGTIAVYTTLNYHPILYVWFSIFGIGSAAVTINIYPMIIELSDQSTTGKYTGFYYTASMSAQIITPILSGALMEFIGYQYLYLYVTIWSILGLLPLLWIKHGDVKTIYTNN